MTTNRSRLGDATRTWLDELNENQEDLLIIAGGLVLSGLTVLGLSLVFGTIVLTLYSRALIAFALLAMAAIYGDRAESKLAPQNAAGRAALFAFVANLALKLVASGVASFANGVSTAAALVAGWLFLKMEDRPRWLSFACMYATLTVIHSPFWAIGIGLGAFLYDKLIPQP